MIARFIVMAVLPLAMFAVIGCSAKEPTLPPLVINTVLASVTAPTETNTTAATISTATTSSSMTTATPTLPPPIEISTPTSVSVMIDTNAQKTYCVALWALNKDGYEILFVNQQVCVFNGKNSLVGFVFVYLVNPQSIQERNDWLNDVGFWLKAQGKNACVQKTIYLTVTLSGSLYDQVRGIPGEKAYFQLGGNAKPTFC